MPPFALLAWNISLTGQSLIMIIASLSCFVQYYEQGGQLITAPARHNLTFAAMISLTASGFILILLYILKRGGHYENKRA